jgi:hypothetical protein
MAVEFPLPQGFQVPQDVEPGQTFDAVASLKLAEDGSAELVSLDGIPIGDDGDEDDKKSSKSQAGSESDTDQGQNGNGFLNALA